MIKDTLTLEKVQRQATKFILNDYENDNKTQLLNCKLARSAAINVYSRLL